MISKEDSHFLSTVKLEPHAKGTNDKESLGGAYEQTQENLTTKSKGTRTIENDLASSPGRFSGWSGDAVQEDTR